MYPEGNGIDNEKREEILSSVKGWITKDQLKNIEDAIDTGKFNYVKYLKYNPEYVGELSDNGGFTPRQQYILRFANRY